MNVSIVDKFNLNPPAAYQYARDWLLQIGAKLKQEVPSQMLKATHGAAFVFLISNPKRKKRIEIFIQPDGPNSVRVRVVAEPVAAGTAMAPLLANNSEQWVNFLATLFDSLKAAEKVTHQSELEEKIAGLRKIARLTEVLKVSRRVNLDAAAKILQVSHDELLDTLISMSDRVHGFRIEGEDIVVEAEDVKVFVDALDQQFKEWHQREVSKSSKKST